MLASHHGGGAGTDNILPPPDNAIDNNFVVPTRETSDNIDSASIGGIAKTDNNATPVNEHPPHILFGVNVGVPSGETNLTDDNVDNTDPGTTVTPNPLEDEAKDCVNMANVAVEVGHPVVRVVVEDNNSSAFNHPRASLILKLFLLQILALQIVALHKSSTLLKISM